METENSDGLVTAQKRRVETGNEKLDTETETGDGNEKLDTETESGDTYGNQKSVDTHIQLKRRVDTVVGNWTQKRRLDTITETGYRNGKLTRHWETGHI